MSEIILAIIIVAIIGTSFYRERYIVDSCEKTIEGIFKQNEIDKHNLTIALKSHTIQDYSTSAVYPDLKIEEESDVESSFQDLDELMMEDPDKFDKLLGV